VKAGRRAVERSANREAIEHLTKAREALDTLTANPTHRRCELDVLMLLGPALIAVDGFTNAEVKRLYTRVRELCRELGDREQEFAAIQALRTLYTNSADLASARAQGEELLELGVRQDSAIYRFEGYRALGIVERYGGNAIASRDYLEQALRAYAPEQLPSFVQLPTGHPGVITLAHLSETLGLLGFAEQAEHRRREAFALADRLAHPFSLAQALGTTLQNHLLWRHPDDASDIARALVTLCSEHGFELWRVWGLGALGWARAVRGGSETGAVGLRDSVATAQRMGAILFETVLLVLLAEALGCIGQIEEGLSVLERQRRLAGKSGLRICDAVAGRVEGELWLKHATPVPIAAEACFQDALSIARRQAAKSLELQAAVALARLWQDQGKQVAAHGLIAPIYAWFTEGFDTADLKDAKALLDELA